MTRRRRTMAVAAVIATALAGSPPALAQARSSARTATVKTQASAIAEIRALNGAMPRSFDLYPADPCAGTWDVRTNGGTAMKLTVFRYRSIPLAHISGPAFDASNQSVTRLDPHSIRIGATGTRLVMRCAGDRAVIEVTAVGDSQPRIFNAVPGKMELPPAAPAPARAPAPPPVSVPVRAAGSVRVDHGNIVYVDARGISRRITDGGYYSDPVLSPDGRTVAFIHLDGRPTEEGKSGFTSLWVADTATGEQHRLLASRPDDEPERNLASFGNPHFSLDGGFVYVDADAWATSSAVHQVNVATGAERFVIAGTTKAIIRNGPNRGYLVVMQHRYRQPAGTGSYDPLFVVRPDGAEVMMVPGSDADDYDADKLLAAWLRDNGWAAW